MARPERTLARLRSCLAEHNAYEALQVAKAAISRCAGCCGAVPLQIQLKTE